SFGREDLRALAALVDGRDLLAQRRRALELRLDRGLLHHPREAERQVLVPALQELRHLPDRLGVALASLPPRARRVAPVDRVLDAGALERAIDRDRAGPQREELAGELERLAHGRRGIEGPIVRRAIVLEPPGAQEARELLVRRDPKEREVL